MRSFDDLLADAVAMHRGCVCPGQVLGVRMAMLGCQLLGIDEPTQGKRLIVYVETDRCMADAIAAVTGCRLGKRTLKHVDYGKCACTFVDTLKERAIRILARDDARDHVWRYVPTELSKSDAQREAYKVMPDEELFVVQEVLVDIPDHDRPGRPVSRVMCSVCGEGINDRREVELNGLILCRACANGRYYQELKGEDPWATEESMHQRLT
ncbi:MAG: formylmethanofuran dehydrogenase [Deltaproteobacteria bacterium CG03_land_8_20_14_0_80_45_14]|nr:MAG: formylmethanofuran dehydrogenase [Deltaproteobacteria bacterium CG03_land_8_20_14_0_80_45_14]